MNKLNMASELRCKNKLYLMQLNTNQNIIDGHISLNGYLLMIERVDLISTDLNTRR